MTDAPSVDLRYGDCLDVLATLPDASVDAVITDPPYGLEFMGREWDGQVPGVAYWAQCLRVLKPGGHLLAFGGTRTVHRLAAAIEDAGFEIRDQIMWIYGSGMPKGQNVGKAIDKMAGAEREVIGTKLGRPGYTLSGGTDGAGILGNGLTSKTAEQRLAETAITAPATLEAARWEGWSTALKPAVEPIIVARAPIRGTVAANVLAHGTGAYNIDACRVAHASEADRHESEAKNQHAQFGTAPGRNQVYGDYSQTPVKDYDGSAGRWPANVVLVHAEPTGEPCQPGCPVAELDAQSGTLKSGANPARRGAPKLRNTYGEFQGQEECAPARGADEGGASRFFPTFEAEPLFRYVAKAPASERPKIDGRGWPTVKPLALMRWLVRLVTPPGGTVCDPFAATMTTGQAARDEGCRSIMIERDEFAYRLGCIRLGLPDPGEGFTAA